MSKKEPEFDINKVVAEFVQQNIEGFASLGTGIFKSAADKVRLNLGRTYKTYLHCIAEKCSRTKSFLISGDPVYLYKFYVPLSVRHGKTVLEKFGFHQAPRCSIIVASGGSGKSMLMKHLVLSAILKKEKVPIFIQLQHLNQSDLNLLGLIQKTLLENKFKLDEEYITKAIKEGHFALFLDGLDEVNEDKRQEVGKEIREFASSHDTNSIIVSSRPDAELEGWQDFTLLRVAPLTLDLACELVDKLPYDQELKDKFLEDLKESLFEKHKSFLSNPLLLTIMLLTFGQSANIPDKLNVFYNQAYEALFERHDARKGGYSRARKTKLDIQDFAKVFSAFCLQTYDKGQLEFTQVETLGLIESSRDIVGINTNKEEFLKDCMQAVCLLVEDGLKIVFSHRSFQEYFTARFIAESQPDIQEKLVQKYSTRIRRDAVLSLLYEIRQDVVEKYFLLPSLDALFEYLVYQQGKFTKEQFLKYTKAAHTDIIFGNKKSNDYRGSIAHKPLGDLSAFTMFTLRLCGKSIGWEGYKTSKSKGDSTWMIEKYGTDDQTEKVFNLSLLKPDDEFVSDLYERGIYFSASTLETLAKVRESIRNRISKKESTLDEILRLKK